MQGWSFILQKCIKRIFIRNMRIKQAYSNFPRKQNTVLKLMFLYIALFDINTDFGAVYTDHFFLQREELFNLILKNTNILAMFTDVLLNLKF